MICDSSPVQVTPSPVYPVLHRQVKLPTVLSQVAVPAQLLVPVAPHSLMSANIKFGHEQNTNVIKHETLAKTKRLSGILILLYSAGANETIVKHFDVTTNYSTQRKLRCIKQQQTEVTTYCVWQVHLQTESIYVVEFQNVFVTCRLSVGVLA